MLLATTDGQIIAANPAACRMYGRTEEELRQIGRSPQLAVMDESVARLIESRGRDGHARGQATLRRSDGGTFRVEISAITFETPEGPRVHVMVTDITEQVRTHRALEILAKAGRVLGESLDIRVTLERFTELVVPQLADICVIEIVDNGESHLVIAHRDPSQVELVRAVRRRSPKSAGVQYATRTGKPQLVKKVTQRYERQNTEDEEHFALVDKMGVTSFISVPLVAHGTMLGAFTLASTGHVSAYDEYDLALAGSLADQAALAIDNARTHDAAVRATRLRDEVLEVVTHDLRNPLNTIKLSAGSLAQHSDAEEIPVMRRAVLRAERLIQDLLLASKMDFTTIPLDRGPASVRAIVDGVAALHQGAAATKALELVATVDGEGDAFVDRHRIAQLLDNLVGNAIQFTDAGSVEIRARVSSSVLVLEVHDTGVGISPEILDHVFDRFWQSAHAGRAGAGLGLAIARGIARAHGGDLTVVSVVGRGTTFIAALPLTAALAQ
jgi:PAS domain S-box-containing protein